MGTAGAGISPRLLPGADQEHLAHAPQECSLGRGALSGARYPGGHGTTVPGG